MSAGAPTAREEAWLRAYAAVLATGNHTTATAEAVATCCLRAFDAAFPPAAAPTPATTTAWRENP